MSYFKKSLIFLTVFACSLLIGYFLGKRQCFIQERTLKIDFNKYRGYDNYDNGFLRTKVMYEELRKATKQGGVKSYLRALNYDSTKVRILFYGDSNYEILCLPDYPSIQANHFVFTRDTIYSVVFRPIDIIELSE